MDNFQHYLAIEAAGGGYWHPKENKIVFVYNAPGLLQIYTTDIKENICVWPQRITFEEDRCTNPRYLSDGSIVFTRDRGGDENFQIGQVDLNSQLNWITSDLKAKHNINGSSENYLYYSANIDDKALFEIYRHKLPLIENKREKIFTPKEGIVSVSVISDDENQIIVNNVYSSIHSDLILVDIENGKNTNLTNKLNETKSCLWETIRFLDNNTLLVNSAHESEFRRPLILSMEGEINFYEEIESNFENDFNSFEFKKESDAIYFTINDQGYTSIFKANFSRNGIGNLDKIDIKLRGVMESGDQRSFIKSMHLNHDGSLLTFTFSSSISPTNLYTVNVNSLKSWKSTNVSTPGLNSSDFSDSSIEKFMTFDNLTIPYFKYLPKGNRPISGWPAILMIHGGPEAQYRPSFNPVVQFYLSSGFAIIAPNIRGSRGYGRNYMDLDNKEKRLDSILDIKHLALHLTQNDNHIDSNNLIIYGGSYGGFAVLSAMTEHPDLWKAGVDIVGISSFVTFLRNTAPWRRKLREGEYGSLDDDLEMLEKISPINKIENIKAPLFIIQGDNDERVPLSESIQMHEKLLEMGLETKLLRFADEGHGVAKLKNRLIAYPQVVNWLKKIID